MKAPQTHTKTNLNSNHATAAMAVRLKAQHALAGLSLIALLSACTAGTDYKRPPMTELKSRWSALEVDSDSTARAKQAVIESSAQEAGSPDVAEGTANPDGTAEAAPTATPQPIWWHALNDPLLEALVSRVVTQNNELLQANQRLTEAEAFRRGEYSGLWPQIDAVATSKREELGAINGSLVDTTHQLGVGGNWTIDVFGGNRRRIEAADAAIEALRAERDKIRLDIIAQTVRAYVQLRSAQQQRVLVERNLESQRETLHMVGQQRNAGAVTDLDVVRAEAQVNTTQARLPQIDATLFAALNRLAVLNNTEVETLRLELATLIPIPTAPNGQIVHLPLQVISQRPDVKQAERRLAQAAALSNAALAEFYPKISLGGFFGVSDSQQFGSASPWNIVANGVLPLLNFGRIRAQVDAANARQEQAFHHYKQTILTALEETENALFAYLSEQKRLEELAAVAELQARATSIAREQYSAGITAQIDLLTAERALLDAQSEVVVSQAAVTANLIALHRALASPAS